MDIEVAEVVDFLSQHAPFSELTAAQRRHIAASSHMRYFRRGTVVIEHGARNNSLYMIRSGAVDITQAEGALVDRDEVGDTFGTSSLLSREPSRYAATAIEDTLALVMPGKLFQELYDSSSIVKDYYDPRIRGRLGRAAEKLQDTDSSILRLNAGDMIGRAPITARPDITIRDAAQIMTDEKISALLLTDEQDKLVGIITDRDLRSRVVLGGVPNTEPVSSVMTKGPVTVGPEMKAFELLLAMTSRNVHHLPVVRDGKAVGMVSSGDIMRLETANPVIIVGDIAKRTDVEGIASVAARAPRVAHQLLSQGADAQDVTHVLTSVADAITGQLIRLAENDLGKAPHPWCWIALGSQARRELGLASDQDHAMIISDDATDMTWYQQMAERVVDGLEKSGFKRCPGDAMATKWQMTASAWKRQFGKWIYEPQSEAVLHAQIFFDARPTHGDFRLFDDVVASTLSGAASAQRFLGHLAAMAVRREPPLTFFRGFVLEGSGEHKNQFDIKAGGLHAIIELMRVLALANGISEPSTLTRIERVRDAGKMSPDHASELIDAFEFISYVRLRHQAGLVAENKKPTNFINPADLSPAERRHLREAFGVVRSAQQGLQYQFQTHLMN